VSNPLNVLYTAVAWVMTRIHAGLSLFLAPGSGAAWVLSIVILVVLMRLVLVPLFVKQMHATRKMSALAPQLQELRKKYKGDKQKLNEETMALYRRNGANPLAGCLPLVAQLPLFFALFNVLRGISDWNPSKPLPYGLTRSVIESAQHASIFGATISDKVLFTGTMNVPLHSKIVILVAVAISVTTTFMTIRQSTKRGMTPQMTPDNPMAASQKYMQYFVPLFALSGLYWQFGLVLYWVTTNVWTLGQQYVLFKRYPPPTPAAAAAGAGAAGGGTSPGSGRGGGKPGGGPAKPGAQPRKDGRPSAAPSAGPSANGGGVLRRFARTRAAEPEQKPAEPPAKIVRQQPQRQSRSKRSGKR
jgi:YidC/Oxa1 family membrane protein insertase